MSGYASRLKVHEICHPFSDCIPPLQLTSSFAGLPSQHLVVFAYWNVLFHALLGAVLS